MKYSIKDNSVTFAFSLKPDGNKDPQLSVNGKYCYMFGSITCKESARKIGPWSGLQESGLETRGYGKLAEEE